MLSPRSSNERASEVLPEVRSDSPPASDSELLDSTASAEPESTPFDSFHASPDEPNEALSHDTSPRGAAVATAPVAVPVAPRDVAQPRPPKRRPLWPWVLLVLLLLGGGAGGAAYLYAERERARFDAWRQASLPMDDPLARVPAPWKVSTLAERLLKSGKIRHEPTFLEAAKAVGLTDVAAGGYALPERAAPGQLAEIFKAGPTHAQVTFPEGFTGLQIAARLRKNGFAGADQFQDLVYPASGFSPYEGTLFPDTYWLPIRGDGKALVAHFQDNFQKKIKELPRPFPKVDGKELTVRELVTLASIVEREAASRGEMPLVAGALVNRLNEPMRLQVDATIQYARVLANQGQKERLLYRDLRIRSPFNTYQNDGLPPTPISNPGFSALKSVARPQQTDALFYVYSPKLKEHRFSRSYSEFLRNKREAARERRDIERASNAGA